MSTLPNDDSQTLVYLNNPTQGDRSPSTPSLSSAPSKFFPLIGSPLQFGAIQADHLSPLTNFENTSKQNSNTFPQPQYRSLPKPRHPPHIEQDHSVMSISGFDFDESKYKTLGQITEALCLDKDEMKVLTQDVVKLISKNEAFCKKTPRPWKSGVWQDFMAEFLSENNRGEKVWSDSRKSALTEDDYTWQENEGEIKFLTFMLLKFECAKYFRTTSKRKTPAPSTTQEPPSKKAKPSAVVEEEESSESEEDSPGIAQDARDGVQNSSTAESEEIEVHERNLSGNEQSTDEDEMDPFKQARAASKNLDMQVNDPSRASSTPTKSKGIKPTLHKVGTSLSPGPSLSFSMEHSIEQTSSPLPTPRDPHVHGAPHRKGGENKPLEVDTSTHSNFTYDNNQDQKTGPKITQVPIAGYLNPSTGPDIMLSREIFSNVPEAQHNTTSNNKNNYQPRYINGSALMQNAGGIVQQFQHYGQQLPSISSYSMSVLPMTPASASTQIPDIIQQQHQIGTQSLHRASADEMVFCITDVEGMNLSPARLLTFSSSASFTQFYGQTILDSSEDARTRIASANQCKVLLPGDRRIVFSLRDQNREKVWSTLMSRAGHAMTQANASLIEVEFSRDGF